MPAPYYVDGNTLLQILLRMMDQQNRMELTFYQMMYQILDAVRASNDRIAEAVKNLK